MKRSPVTLEDVADFDNLANAFHLAAKGKSMRPEVLAFGADLYGQLYRLQDDLLSGDLRLGRMTRFSINDPKPRTIHAPAFRERVLHQALMARVGSVLDKALVDDCYACRVGKGGLAAVKRAQHHMRRHGFVAKIDVSSYFASIDHDILMTLLARRFKNRDLLDLLGRIISSYETARGKGLPIGALTSQHFANFYLSGIDRFLLENCKVGGMARYMDDILWWDSDRQTMRSVLAAARAYLRDHLKLEIKPAVQINSTAQGMLFCGFRVLPGRLLLSRRRKRRYIARRRYWEEAYLRGEVDALSLQAGYASALAITLHADATAWRREQLRRTGLASGLEEV